MEIEIIPIKKNWRENSHFTHKQYTFKWSQVLETTVSQCIGLTSAMEVSMGKAKTNENWSAVWSSYSTHETIFKEGEKCIWESDLQSYIYMHHIPYWRHINNLKANWKSNG